METQLKCVEHAQQAIMIKLNNNQSFIDKLLCQQCLLRNKEKTIPISNIQSQIKQLKEQSLKEVKEQISYYINSIILFQQKTYKLMDDIQQQSRELIQKTKQWVDELIKIQNQKIDTDQMKEIEVFIEQNLLLSQSENENLLINLKVENWKFLLEIDQQLSSFMNNLNSISKLEQILQKLKLDSQELKLQNKQIQINNQINDECKQSSKYQGCIVQDEVEANQIRAISFNYDNSLMITGNQIGQIQIWNLENGQIKNNSQILKQISNNKINCFATSKKTNWFVSGGYDYSIICWQKQSNQQWQNSNPFTGHNSYIIQLILNAEENRLFSSSEDSTIRIWNVNILNNQIQNLQVLQHKENGGIYGIALNQTQNYLISTSINGMLTLWTYQNNLWSYLYQQKQTCTGFRILFTNNNSFLWQPANEAFSYLYTIIEDKILLLYDESIQLYPQLGDDWLYPTIMNEQKQIIIQKHGLYTYLIQKIEPSKFIILKAIKNYNLSNFGALTNDGQYLAIYDWTKGKITLYQIKYDI